MRGSKPLRWLGGTLIETPPIGEKGRRSLGAALRVLQEGGQLTMPVSRPMPSVGSRCHELRVGDDGRQWRLLYRIDADAILVIDVFRKTTQKTPARIIERGRNRLQAYDGGQRSGGA
jgi:phage-related protein